MTSRFVKDPDATLDYTVNWASEDGTNDGSSSDTGWLQGDTITASTWTVPAGLTRVSDSNTDTTATIFISGGTAGKRYRLTNKITTVGGRIEERTLTITVIQR